MALPTTFSGYRMRKQKEITAAPGEKQLGMKDSIKLIYGSVNNYFGLNQVIRIDRLLWWAYYIVISLTVLFLYVYVK